MIFFLRFKTLKKSKGLLFDIAMASNSQRDPSPPSGTLKRSRKLPQWKRNQAKKLRNMGQSYISTSTGMFVPARKIGPPCLCPKGCYEKVGEENISALFNNYWNSGSWDIQTAYIQERTHISAVKRYRTNDPAKMRSCSRTYSVCISGEEFPVCKKAFAHIHGIGVHRLDRALDNKTNTSITVPDRRGKHGHQVKLDPNMQLRVSTHIKSFPTITSHYSKNKSPHIRYSVKGVTSRRQMHGHYLKWMAENYPDEQVSSWHYYCDTMKKYFPHLSFYKKRPESNKRDRDDMYSIKVKKPSLDEEAKKLLEIEHSLHLGDAYSGYHLPDAIKASNHQWTQDFVYSVLGNPDKAPGNQEMELPMYTVDAFTSKKFGGNPAAVVPTRQKLSDEIMQKVAMELNLSETAYIVPLDKESFNSSRFSLRWFTPTNEVNLCGHATLSAAHVLFHCLKNKKEVIEFETLSGVLMARRSGDYIILDFPANPPGYISQEEWVAVTPLVETIAAKTFGLGHLEIEDVRLSKPTKKLLIRLKDHCSRHELEKLVVDSRRLLQVHDGSLVKGIIVTLKGDPSNGSYDVLSRYFAPWNGIPEDPVTGSAHTVLGPYWSQVLGLRQLNCYQSSSRGGNIHVTMRDDGRVDLAGRSVTVIKGNITI